jgi:hypothetical protein
MTTNGRSLSNLLVLSSCCVVLLLWHPLQAGCGNLEMVEKNVAELETVNRDAVKQIGGLPRDGTVDLKAYVTEEGNKKSIRIVEKKIVIKGAAGLSGKESAPAGVNVSAPVADRKIDFLEQNGQPIKTSPGGSNVR